MGVCMQQSVEVRGYRPGVVLTYLQVGPGVPGHSGWRVLRALSLPFVRPFALICFGCVTLEHWGPWVSPEQQSLS